MFVAVPPGGETRLFVGFQGASHLFAGLLLVGPAPEGGVRLAWTVTDAADDSVLAMSEAPLGLSPADEPNTLQSQNQLVQFGGPASQFDGRDVQITVQMVDFATREVLAEHTQIVRLRV
jgi:hypothetical protein